jgi:hypothetical protein
MQVKKKVEVPAKVSEVLDKVLCDFCDKEIKQSREYGEKFCEPSIKCEEGKTWPSGGSGTNTSMDCCGECWNKKVLPALKAISLREPKVTDWYF